MKMILRTGGCSLRQPLSRTDSTGTLKAVHWNTFCGDMCSQMCALPALTYGQVCAQRREALLDSKIFIWDGIKLKYENNGQNLAFTLRRRFPETQLCFCRKGDHQDGGLRHPGVQGGCKLGPGFGIVSLGYLYLWEEIFLLIQVQSPNQNYNKLPPQTHCRCAQQVIGWNCNSNSSHLCFTLNAITNIYIWASNFLLQWINVSPKWKKNEQHQFDRG